MYRVVGQNTAFLGRKVAGFLVGFHEFDGKELSRSHHKDGLTELVGYVKAHPHLNPQPLSPSPLSVATWAHHQLQSG